MQLLMNVTAIWMALDAVIICALLIAVSVIQPLFPNWWKSVVCDYAPESFD